MEDPRLLFEERVFSDKCRQRSRKLFRGADSCGIFLFFPFFFFWRGTKINYVLRLITLIFDLEGNWEWTVWTLSPRALVSNFRRLRSWKFPEDWRVSLQENGSEGRVQHRPWNKERKVHRREGLSHCRWLFESIIIIKKHFRETVWIILWNLRLIVAIFQFGPRKNQRCPSTEPRVDENLIF